MGEKLNDFLRNRAFQRSLLWWQKEAARAKTADAMTLRRIRGRARQLRREIERTLHIANSRLTRFSFGNDTIRRPLLCDWAWRPEIWSEAINPPGKAAVADRTMIGQEVMVFHDCETSELTLRQIHNRPETDRTLYGLEMDVFRFDGSFLSLVIDLPEDALQGLRLTHVIRMDVSVEMEKPIKIFARLNIKHGPNSDQIVRELPIASDDVAVEFDLAYSHLNEKRVERAWIDLIFEGPEMNQIVLRDVTLSRRPRADL